MQRIEELAGEWLADPQYQYVSMSHVEKIGANYTFELRTSAQVSADALSAMHDTRYVYISKGRGPRVNPILSFELNRALEGAPRDELQELTLYDSQEVTDLLAETMNVRPEAYRLLGTVALLANRAATGSPLPVDTLHALDRVYRYRMEDAYIRTELVALRKKTGLGVSVFSHSYEGNTAHADPVDDLEAALTVEARSAGVGTVYTRARDGSRETYARKVIPPRKSTAEEMEHFKADADLYMPAEMGGLAAQSVIRQAERLAQGLPDFLPEHLSTVREAMEAFEP